MYKDLVERDHFSVTDNWVFSGQFGTMLSENRVKCHRVKLQAFIQDSNAQFF